MPEGTPPRELNPGDHIGRYRIVRPLGRGGMGVVYVASDDRLDRDVALKMIAGPADETARSRFWREARAAASVSHPHICQVFEVDESGDGIFLTMELLEGEGLDRRLDARRIGRRTMRCRSHSACWARWKRCMPADSCIATSSRRTSSSRRTDRSCSTSAWRGPRSAADTPTPSATTPVTGAGMIIGTPQYMAPEQVTGAALDGRTDLYAAGAVIFQMLAGRPPFTGTGADVLFAALKENPPALQGPPDGDRDRSGDPARDAQGSRRAICERRGDGRRPVGRFPVGHARGTGRCRCAL